jgi:hypothetical protein
MKPKPQSKATKADELSNRGSATIIFGLGMTAIFIAMLILNAIS